MSRARATGFRGAIAVRGVLLGAVLIAGCGTTPAPSAPASSPAASSTPAVDVRPGPPAAFEHVPDGPTLHGSAVGRPRLVVLPDGSFLMLMSQDIARRGDLLRSDDGRTWHKLDVKAAGLDAGAIIDLAANDTVVAVLGSTGPLAGTGTEDVPDLGEWTSTDGRTWTRAQDGGTLRAFGASQLVGSSGGFAAVGDASTAILLSGADGRGWRRTELPVPFGARGDVGRVVPFGEGFLAAGSVGVQSALWRWDGTRWSRLPLGATDSFLEVAGIDDRLMVAGSTETPDPVTPDQSIVAAFAWESANGGQTWIRSGLPLDGITEIGVFAIDGWFLALLSPNDQQARLTAFRSLAPGTWEPVSLGDGGTGFERPYVSALARSGRRVVLAGNTVGTGAGGDRVVIWVGDATAP